MHIPFVDLKTQYVNLRPQIDAALQTIIDETAFIRGRHVAAFEKAFAGSFGFTHCIGVANGTDAIYITLKMLGIGPGDEVITAANSWISTSEAITQTGARPVFVDVEPDYYHINAELIERKITKKTKAVLPVHLYGQPAAMDRIADLCRKHNLLLVEDCAQAHLAEYRGKRVGLFGIAGTFSFYPGKNLGAYGDAGAIGTNEDGLAERVRKYANHGSLIKHEHEIEGVNSRLDGMQAAILSVKLPHLAGWNRRRYEHAMRYGERLEGIEEISVPVVRPGATHIFHVYCVRAARRDELAKFLNDRGVETAVHYPTALPFLRAYRHLGHRPEDFPVAHAYQSRILSLPMFPELTEAQSKYVTDQIKAFFA